MPGRQIEENLSHHADRLIRLGNSLGPDQPTDLLGLSPGDYAWALAMRRHAMSMAQSKAEGYQPDVMVPDDPVPTAMTGAQHQDWMNQYRSEMGLAGPPGSPSDPDERSHGPYVDFVDRHGWAPQMFAGRDHAQAAALIAGQLRARRKRALGMADPSLMQGPLL